jgi:hypothetical protein
MAPFSTGEASYHLRDHRRSHSSVACLAVARLPPVIVLLIVGVGWIASSFT